MCRVSDSSRLSTENKRFPWFLMKPGGGLSGREQDKLCEPLLLKGWSWGSLCALVPLKADHTVPVLSKCLELQRQSWWGCSAPSPLVLLCKGRVWYLQQHAQCRNSLC